MGHVTKNQPCNEKRSNTSIVNSASKKSSQTFIYLKDIGAEVRRECGVGVRRIVQQDISKDMGTARKFGDFEIKMAVKCLTRRH